MPNEKEIQSFKALYEKQFGEVLSDEDATDGAIRLLHIFVLTNPKLVDIWSL